MSSKYKQIGNAVPVNLASAIGRSIIRLLNDIEALSPQADVTDEIHLYPTIKLHGMFEGMVCEKTSDYKKVESKE